MKDRKTKLLANNPLKRPEVSKTSQSFSNFPFSAIVGQEEMKLGLILNVIDPSIGGVLIMGHRGTGKSTAVRGLAELLPEVWVAKRLSLSLRSGGREDCLRCLSRRVGNRQEIGA